MIQNYDKIPKEISDALKITSQSNNKPTNKDEWKLSGLKLFRMKYYQAAI